MGVGESRVQEAQAQSQRPIHMDPMFDLRSLEDEVAVQREKGGSAGVKDLGLGHHNGA